MYHEHCDMCLHDLFYACPGACVVCMFCFFLTHVSWALWHVFTWSVFYACPCACVVCMFCFLQTHVSWALWHVSGGIVLLYFHISTTLPSKSFFFLRNRSKMASGAFWCSSLTIPYVRSRDLSNCWFLREGSQLLPEWFVLTATSSSSQHLEVV